jgi:hypothetical protein
MVPYEVHVDNMERVKTHKLASLQQGVDDLIAFFTAPPVAHRETAVLCVPVLLDQQQLVRLSSLS